MTGQGEQMLNETEELLKSEPHGLLHNEISWQKLCLEIPQKQDLSKLVKSCQQGSSHYEPSYILETFLWQCAVPSPWVRARLSLKTLKRRKAVNLSREPNLAKLCLRLDAAIEAPLLDSLALFDQATSRTGALKTLDKEVLTYLAIARILSNKRCFDLAAFALAEYAALSHRASGGRSNDCLNCASDLLEQSWFRSFLHADK